MTKTKKMGAPGWRAHFYWLVLVVVIMATGLWLRYGGAPFSDSVRKYGGSMLWAAMVYALIRAARPQAQVRHAAGAAALIALAVELFRLVHTPDLDAFRLTLGGQLLLGRVFSLWNIAAYFAAIGICAIVEFGSVAVRDGR